MYTSECRTITNVNTVERGRYRGRLFTATAIVIKIGVQIIWIAQLFPITSISLTFKAVKKQEKRKREREIHKETQNTTQNKFVNYKVYLIILNIK